LSCVEYYRNCLVAILVAWSVSLGGDFFGGAARKTINEMST